MNENNATNTPERLGSLVDFIAFYNPDAVLVVPQLSPMSMPLCIDTSKAAMPSRQRLSLNARGRAPALSWHPCEVTGWITC